MSESIAALHLATQTAYPLVVLSFLSEIF
uniref:Uncharacterized protein n=1 Tax=Rhizophora mucronata TaxID=61149 RepID=A0A2P2NPZ9_RHIMU